MTVKASELHPLTTRPNFLWIKSCISNILCKTMWRMELWWIQKFLWMRSVIKVDAFTGFHVEFFSRLGNFKVLHQRLDFMTFLCVPFLVFRSTNPWSYLWKGIITQRIVYKKKNADTMFASKVLSLKAVFMRF